MKLTEKVNNQEWPIIQKAKDMRNDLIHGVRVYRLDKCREQAEYVLDALDSIKTTLQRRYEYSGWEKFKKRLRPCLHKDPK